MDKMNIIQTKPIIHLSTYTMETSDRFDNNDKIKDNFDEDIHKYIHRIYHCSNRSQAIILRTNALKFIDQWRLQHVKQLDQRVRTAGQLILNAFDEYQSKQQYIKCPHRLKQSLDTSNHKSSIITSITTMPTITKDQSIGSRSDLSSSKTIDLLDNHYHLQKNTKQNIEISIDKLKSSSSSSSIVSSPTNRNITLNSIDFGRDFTFDTLAYLSSLSNDIAMTICENNTLIYSQHSNELVIVSLMNLKHIAITQLDKNSCIRDLCYVDWLYKCLVITDKQIYLLDYQTTKHDIIDKDIGYICGAIDNHRCVFYLVKQSTLHKYDKNSLLNLRSDQYPIADGYYSRRVALDNKTNDYLALLVGTNDEKNYILVYSTLCLSNGYLYKILIDDRIERQWICSNGNYGWLIHGTHPGSCFDLNINGLNSIRIFDCNEIRNIIPMIDKHQRFIIRTKTEIFVLIKYSFVQSFKNFNK
ncbi:unnamed protein product [Rotaria sordida]|uniref:Uncharacterized protein n=1 Tax=Rotaria sordida TaxID=392033 RepID=A0A813TS17_9BILA|nr:unnamed protein product [Rotaria sordida]CAF3563675.1 unnamed protein product [Rotaria sordida]